MFLVVGIIIVVLLVVAFWLGPSIFGTGPSAEDELLRLCRNDRAQMERLISAAQKRKPAWSREKAAQAAAYSLRRDKR